MEIRAKLTKRIIITFILIEIIFPLFSYFFAHTLTTLLLLKLKVYWKLIRIITKTLSVFSLIFYFFHRSMIFTKRIRLAIWDKVVSFDYNLSQSTSYKFCFSYFLSFLVPLPTLTLFVIDTWRRGTACLFHTISTEAEKMLMIVLQLYVYFFTIVF